MKAYFDNNRKFIGISSRKLSDLNKDLTDNEYKSIISAYNKLISLAEDNTLIFIDKPPELPPKFEEIKKIEDLNKQQVALEQQKHQMVLTTMEMHEQAMMEIIQCVELKGGETMVINIIVARIVNGLMEYSKVPAPIKPQVRQGLIDLGLEFLIVE